MMAKINTDIHTLGNHEYSGALVGIWPNRTFDTGRDKIMQQGGESPQAAQQLTEDLVVTHIKYSLRMMSIWNNVVKEWRTPLTGEETDTITELQKGKTTIEAIAKFNRVTMAWEGKWSTSINNLSTRNVPTCAEDIALDEVSFKKDIPAMTLWENRANWSMQDLNAWKSISRQIEGFLKRPASLSRIELYGKGQYLKKKWQDFLDIYNWEALLLEVERQATEKGGSKWGNLVAMAINIHPEGEEEDVSKYQRQKRKIGDDMDTKVSKKQKQEKIVVKSRTDIAESDITQNKLRKINTTQVDSTQVEKVDTIGQARQIEKKGKKRIRDEQEGPAILPPPYYLPCPPSPHSSVLLINTPPWGRPGLDPAIPDG